MSLLKGARFTVTPPAIRGYRAPKGQTVTANADQVITLGYQKITAPGRTICAAEKTTKPAASKPTGSKPKQKIGWFEKNTGLTPRQQHVFFTVLKAIEQDGRKHHKSAAEIKRDQLYFISRSYKKVSRSAGFRMWRISNTINHI